MGVCVCASLTCVGVVCVQLSVPDEIAGALIGKGGYKINEIRQMSQAHVKIAERVPGAMERVVTVTGTPEAVQLAIYLVQTRSVCSGGLA